MDSNSDTIDSREIIERIEELENEGVEQDTPEGEEYEALKTLAEEGESTYGAEWAYGVTLVRDSYFEDYARELAEEIGGLSGFSHGEEITWPLQYIDWEAAAEALQIDYMEIEFEGVTYWGRA